MTRGINRGRPLGGGHASAPSFRLVPPELIVEFAMRWHQFGGGPAEEMMVRFGWCTNRYFTELQSILLFAPPPGLDHETIASMIQVCSHRIRSGA